jgi:hypothetical protein
MSDTPPIYDEEDVSYPSGWLWKVGSQVPTWRRRFFKLEAGCLVYYKDKPPPPPLRPTTMPTATPSSSNRPSPTIKPIGAVIIDASCRIEMVDSYTTRLKSSRKDCIRLLGGHGRCIILAPDISKSSLTSQIGTKVGSRDIDRWYDALSIEIGRFEIEALMLVEKAKLAKQRDNKVQFNSIPFPKSHFNFNSEGQSVMITGVALNSRPSRCFSAPILGSNRSTSSDLHDSKNRISTKKKAGTMANTSTHELLYDEDENDENNKNDNDDGGDEMVLEIDSTLRAVLRTIPNIKECDGGYIPKFEDLHYFFSPPDSCIPLSSCTTMSAGSYGSLSVSERYSQFIINTSTSVLTSLSISEGQASSMNNLTMLNRATSLRLQRPVSMQSQLSSSSLLGSPSNRNASTSSTTSSGGGGGGAMQRRSSSSLVLSQYQRRSSTLVGLANNQWKGFNFDWEENNCGEDESDESDGE